MLVCVALFFLGGEVLNTFALALIIGIVVGTYSSIYVAAAIVVIWKDLRTGRKLQVAAIPAEMKADDVSIVVGLLHDVLEDTLTTKQSIAKQFGPEVAELVDGLTKIGKFSYVSREQEQAETFRKMILAMVSDLRVVLVKLADRLHNMRTLQHLPEGKRREIARQTLDIYAPIANRLGMGLGKGAPEALAFLHLEPEEYARVALDVERRMKGSQAMIEKIRARLAEKMAEAG